MEMQMSWASTYAEERAGALYDAIFKTQRAGKCRYPKNLLWLFLFLKHKQPPRRTELSRTLGKPVNLTSTI